MNDVVVSIQVLESQMQTYCKNWTMEGLKTRLHYPTTTRSSNKKMDVQADKYTDTQTFWGMTWV